MSRFLLLICAVSVLLACATAEAKLPSIGVVYPEVREPYRSVFVEIVQGMEDVLGYRVVQYPLSEQQDFGVSLISRIKSDQIDVVVTLGRAGYMVAKSLSRELPVVVGAVMLPLDSNSQELSGISLTPDPDIMFARLQELLPQIRNITVVYNPEQKYGEILRAKQAAQHRGLTLQALQSTDLRHSAAIYQRVLQKIEDDSSAIWLLSDNAAMDEQALLPVVLRAAWEKHFVVVSSNPDHVRKGALISLFPDNFDMGRSLAIMARSRVQDPLRQGGSIEPLRDLRTAVNLRTAEHLGLNFTSADRRKFGLTFPSRP